MDLRFYITYLKTLLLKFRYLILLASVIGASAFILFKFIYPQMFPKTALTGIVGQYRLDNLPLEVSQKISKSLVSVDDNGLLTPQIATTWKNEDNAKVWIFEISPDYNAKDLPISIKGAKISYPDKHTIRFELQQSYVSFPYLLTKPLIKKGGESLGNTKIIKLKTNRDLVTSLLVEYPNKKREQFLFYPTNELAFTAMKMGKLDRLLGIKEVGDFINYKNVKAEAQQNDNEIVLLFYNTESKFFSSKEARVALNYGLDKSSLGGKRVLTTVYSKGLFYNTTVKRYDYDVTRAKVVAKDTLLKIVTTPDLVNTAEKIKSDWEKVGVKSEVFVTTITPTNFDAYITTFTIPYDPDQYPLWHSTQTDTNISRYNSPRIDKLLEDGRVTTDLEARKKIYFDFQRFLAEDCPAIPLFYTTYYNLERI